MREPQITVSVVIPTFNRSDVLQEAVNSVLYQTHLPHEIIVVDDASTDDTERMEVSRWDLRIRYIRLNAHSGAPTARNMGVTIASGQWIAFLDSDDLWLPTKLEEQIKAIQTSGDHIAAVATNVFIRRPDKSDYLANSASPRFDDQLSIDLLVRDMTLQTSTLLIKRSVLLVEQFDTSLKRHQDWDLVLRLTAAGYAWKYLQKPLSIYRVNSDPRRISIDQRSPENTLFWFSKSKHTIRQEAKAYYFSFRCLPKAFRLAPVKALQTWLTLSFASGRSSLYSLKALMRLGKDGFRRLLYRADV